MENNTLPHETEQVFVVFASLGMATNEVAIYDSRWSCSRHEIKLVAIVNSITPNLEADQRVKNFTLSTGSQIMQFLVSGAETKKMNNYKKKLIQTCLQILPNFVIRRTFKMRLFIKYSFPHNSRFFWYVNVLKSIEGNVIFMDSRDAKFQRCPGCLMDTFEVTHVYTVLEGKQNAITLKPHSLFLNKSNKRWIDKLLGINIRKTSRWGDHSVLCSGVILGPNTHLLDLFNSMINVMLNSKYFLTEFLDQSALNYIFYNFEIPIKTVTNGDPIFHMATTPDGAIEQAPPHFEVVDGKVLIGNRTPYIIHQFDRFPQLNLN